MSKEAYPSVEGSDLMVLETPLLRVSRPVAACSRCRAAKVKCDGKLPACTACEKSNRASECSSTNDQFARGKERSYVATLEARVERLEKKIAESRNRRKSSTILMLDTSEAATPRRTSVDTLKAPKPISKRAARRKEASQIDELVSDFGLLAVNATARDFYGFTTEMSYARLILSAAAKEALPTGLHKALPAKYAATPLIQHFLNNVFVLVPVFEEASLYASVDAIYQQGDVATPWDKWIVRMVLAIACLSQSDQRGDAHYSDAVGHVNAALENAEDVLHPGYVTSIQALVLFTIYAAMDPHHFDSWTLIGAASRAMIDLGIHQDPSRNIVVSKSKLEIRRRVYWCVYAIDRSTSLVQTRSFSFSDEATNVAFPFNNNTSTSPRYSSPQTTVFQQNFDGALDLFRMREIQSAWYMDLFQSGREPWPEAYTYIWKQYARMTDWFNDIPQSTLPTFKTGFELELLYSYVYILSPSPRLPHIDEYAQRLIFEHCISYSIILLAILNKPSSPSKSPVTFYDAMRAYMTGRQFVDVLSRNLDAILSPVPPSPPVTTNSPVASEDPLAPHAQVGPPPFPTPQLPEGQITPLDPTMRAINALNDFTQILSNFGLRFGFTHWRDRFQRESAALSAQLYQRKSTSPHTSPPSQMPSTGYPQQWVPMPSVSPRTPGMMYPGPTTPPSLFPQSSPFSGTVPYTGNPFDAAMQSPYSQTLPYDHSPQPQSQHPHMYATPSPQPIPDMPQPTDGTRRAMVYGAGITRQHSGGQGHENGVAHAHAPSQDGAQWPHAGQVQHQQTPSQVDNNWTSGTTHEGGAVQWAQGTGHGNWG